MSEMENVSSQADREHFGVGVIRQEPCSPRVPVSAPELLAPAGDWDCAKAAVENGADAIYFGLERFNARMRAHNFTEADLPALMEFLHRRGVKGYVTFNTLVFQNELAEAEQCLRTIIACGVDAAIVQDVGICRLIRSLSRDFPIHVSTQMTITSAAGVEFARELGCNLVVLARECSLKEIEKIQATQIRSSESKSKRGGADSIPPFAPAGLPLEVFVHGALCVAYSGQCLTSEALGGRSANRGECAQACRMPYELISDGIQVALGDRKYLLSPQDLAGLEVLPELLQAGVTSLKIEGRLKSPEYVANITRVYRSALDRLTALNQRGAEDIPTNSTYDMEMAFSRGLYSGWFRGTNNQALVHARFGKKRGVFLGEVLEVRSDAVRVDLKGPIKPGDGIVFDSGHPEEKEEGGRVYEVRNLRPDITNKQTAELSFGHGHIDFSRVLVGDKVWKTDDPELDRRLRQTFDGDEPHFQQPIHLEVYGDIGQPLRLIARDEHGNIAQLDSSMPLTRAAKQPLTTERMRQQLGRLGGTPFKLGELKNSLRGHLILPVSELNRLRRDVVQQLEALRIKPKRWKLENRLPVSGPHTANEHARPEAEKKNQEQLIVLVRNLSQLDATLQQGIKTIYCEFEDPKKYREAVERVRIDSTDGECAEIFVAPPRIFKMGEEWTLKQVRSCNADGYLVRNFDHLEFFAADRRVGDFSLNIANRLSADYFRSRFGLERVTASYDLNFTQLEALLMNSPPEWFEITIHQHIPMFHMEHCVFCAFLSKGTDYTNCGRPCDKHDVRLRDRVGAEHPVKADVGCRNTVFQSKAQTGAEYLGRMLALGVKHFRIEFLNETPDQVFQTIEKYRQLLCGEIKGPELWQELKLLNQLGVTRGQIGK
jgi:putative protease